MGRNLGMGRVGVKRALSKSPLFAEKSSRQR
jgi:hypothetical protein